jgi:hypothetical protein
MNKSQVESGMKVREWVKRQRPDPIGIIVAFVSGMFLMQCFLAYTHAPLW